jgi:hypothetical protein
VISYPKEIAEMISTAAESGVAAEAVAMAR